MRPPPERLGRFEILQPLGRGAMGTVFLARDAILGRSVALKAFDLGFATGDPEEETFRRRFLREARNAGSLSHPNVVTVHDVGEDAETGICFITMEYVPGETLGKVLQREGRLDLPRAATLITGISAALDYLHSRGVVHRDIKPANILITPEGVIKLTDFGIARTDAANLSLEGDLLGTPNYMAPEQVTGAPVDRRTDIFALGIVLYEMVVGARPFRGESVPALVHTLVYEPHVPVVERLPGAPPELEAVLSRALAKDPDQRYPSAGELARDLIIAAAGGAIEAPPPDPNDTQALPTLRLEATPRGDATAVPPPPRWRLPKTLLHPPSRGLFALLIVLGVALGAALGFLAVGVLSPPEPAAIDAATRQDFRLRWVPLVLEGRRQLAAGEPEKAAVFFEIAERLAPGKEEIAELREQAEALAAAAREQQRLADARRGLKARQDKEILEQARAIMAAADPQERKEVLAALSGEVVPQAASDAAASPALVTVELTSGVARGTLTLYAGGRQVLREPFDFRRRVGFFRTVVEPGSVRFERSLPAGPTTFLIYVAPGEQPAEMVDLRAKLPGGAHRTLAVRFPRSGELSASWN